jgi:hypothetical protein
MKSGASATPSRDRAGIVELLHGSARRGRRLRARGQVTVRDSKWKHERMTSRERQRRAGRAARSHAALHQEDLSAGFGRVWLPDAIAAHWIPHDEYRGRNMPASAGRYTANRAVAALSKCLLGRQKI